MVNNKGMQLVQRINIINDTINKFKEGNKDILRNIIMDWDINMYHGTYAVLKEILEGNNKKIKSYGFTEDEIKYVYGNDFDYVNTIKDYIDRVD
jgi:basic membrane lipoprotein Med (substrate-binding protein (PBP1-ABC) superfamily)